MRIATVIITHLPLFLCYSKYSTTRAPFLSPHKLSSCIKFQLPKTLFSTTTTTMSSEINKNTNKSPRILSIQSHTVHGYVGNKASTFPLQCLGLHVDAINSITLSNHPGYSSGFKGKVLEADQLTALIDGLSGNNLLGHDAVLTGYVRSLDLLQGVEAALKKVRSVNPSAIYICDPVLGDNGRFYVPEELAIFYRDVLLPLASVVTPNQFEAEVLSGTTIKTHADALTTCRYFHSRGVRTVVLKGLHFADDSFAMYLSHQESDTPNDITDSSPEQRIHTFRLDLTRISDRTFSGCGDLLSALIAGHLVQRFLQHGSTHSLPLSLLAQSLEETGTLMSAVLQETLELGSKELALIESAELFFKARQILLQEPKENFDLFPTTILSNECYKVHGPICGIIFDMDGTLTEGGAINFAAMYERTGLARSGDILKSIREEITDLEQRRKAHRVVREEELLGAEKCIPRPGLRELLHHLRRERVRVAIATRNCDEAVEHFLKLTDLPRDLFTHIIHRDSILDDQHPWNLAARDLEPHDLMYVNKPDPRVAQFVLADWTNLSPGRVMFVGDSIDDMLCGRNAGCVTCLIRTPETESLLRERPELIDMAIDNLLQLRQYL